MLTAAGAAATGIAGSASAVLVDFNHGLDRWAGEHAFQVFSSGGAQVAGMASMSYYSGVVSGTFGYSTNSASTGHWGNVWGQYDLASGTYNVQMQDSYGDGWAWGSYVGGLTIGSGSASFPSSMGGSASFSFTVVPAPSALALLGLAGFAARRRK